MATATQLMTADDLLKLPDDGTRYELVRGELRQMSPAGSEHGKIALKIGRSLENYVEEHDLGDVAFVRKERVKTIGKNRSYWPETPDLAVEVISHDDLYLDVIDKITDFLTAGTKMMLVIDPYNRTTAVYRSVTSGNVLTEADTIDGEDVVPGWTCAVRDVFA